MGLFSYAQSLLDYGNRLAYNRVQGSSKQPTKNMTKIYQGQKDDGTWEEFEWDNNEEPTEEETGYKAIVEGRQEMGDEDMSGASDEPGYANDR